MFGNILLVDDNRDFREEFATALMEYNVKEASSGEEALNILSKPHEIDLVLLDVRMPGMSGTKVLRKIKQMAENVGVVILTGYSTKDIAIDALRGDADDYIEKPLDIDKTKKIIASVLKEKRGADNLNTIDSQDKVERVKKFIRRNAHKRLKLKDAADIVHLSPKYLSRIFKEHAGVLFNDYRLKVKIEEAEKMLKNTGASISHIAYDLGYKNAESFIRRFKDITGYTPAEYREKHSPKKKK